MWCGTWRWRQAHQHAESVPCLVEQQEHEQHEQQDRLRQPWMVTRGGGGCGMLAVVRGRRRSGTRGSGGIRTASVQAK